MATYTALLKKQLIARDTSTNLRAGQRVTLTPAGQAALHKHLARRHGLRPTDIRTSAP
jgi:DNA-binding MarR family transcriptional regulator